MSFFNFIIWNVDPEIFRIPLLDREVRWYGLLFAIGFLISQQIMFFIYRKEGKPEKNVEALTVFMVVATILGARLGHVFFYEPEKYLAHPLDILKIWEGGLASHGAAFGILFALWLYSRYFVDISFSGIKVERIKRPGQNYFQIVDRIVIVVAVCGCLIRFGNLMNSEIYGVPTQSTYGFVFTNSIDNTFSGASSPIESIDYDKDDERSLSEEGYVPIDLTLNFKNQPEVLNQEAISGYIEGHFSDIVNKRSYTREHILLEDKPKFIISQNSNGSYSAVVQAYGIARHPTQLYESLTTLAIGILLFLIWWHYRERTPSGLLLGIFLILLFGLRFVHELFKENQVAFEDEMTFNMGQILSIPLIIAGIIILLRALNRGPEPALHEQQ